MADIIYLETSLFGFYFDPHERNLDKRNAVRRLFRQVRKGVFIGICSSLVRDELADAESDATRLLSLIRRFRIEVIDSSSAGVERLAEQYRSNGIISTAMMDDARHVAAATLLNVDVLVSLNLKHIANTWRERRFNEVNTKLGHPAIRIATPEEVIRQD